MNNSKRGSVSLTALLIASFLMSLGGTGALAAYFQKNPSDFMAQLHEYFAARVNAQELAPLDTVTPTPEETMTPTPILTPLPTLTTKPSIAGIRGGGDDEEEIKESGTVNLHEREDDDP